MAGRPVHTFEVVRSEQLAPHLVRVILGGGGFDTFKPNDFTALTSRSCSSRSRNSSSRGCKGDSTVEWHASRMAFGDYQLEIYLQGLSGIVPSLPMTFAELEERAQAALSPSLWSYVAGGSGDERTQRGNVTAFEGWGLMPRMFVGANDRDLSVDLFGMTLPSPILMAPVAVLGAQADDAHRCHQNR